MDNLGSHNWNQFDNIKRKCNALSFGQNTRALSELKPTISISECRYCLAECLRAGDATTPHPWPYYRPPAKTSNRFSPVLQEHTRWHRTKSDLSVALKGVNDRKPSHPPSAASLSHSHARSPHTVSLALRPIARRGRSGARRLLNWIARGVSFF